MDHIEEIEVIVTKDKFRINSADFFKLVDTELGINLEEDHIALVSETNNAIQSIIAGPGTGKTTIMVLRILYLLFVDDLKPNELMVTTFTRKAAAELFSRIQTWGIIIFNKIQKLTSVTFDLLDFNTIRIGTLDRLIKDFVTEIFKTEGVISNILGSEGHQIMLLREINNLSEQEIEDICNFYLTFAKEPWLFTLGPSKTMVKNVIQEFESKIMQNIVDIDEFVDGPVKALIISILKNIWHDLEQKKTFSHTFLNLYLLELIKTPDLPSSTITVIFPSGVQSKLNEFTRMTREIRYLIVDEYQDTNLLQELTYFEIYRHMSDHSKGFSIVGDDDQSLYQFRGSHVEIFTHFVERISNCFNSQDLAISQYYLSRNFRSTFNIVEFTNSYIDLFPFYKSLRYPHKSNLKVGTNFEINPPVLRISASEPTQVIDKILSFFGDLFSDSLNIDGQKIPVDPDLKPSDVTYLSRSVNERYYDERKGEFRYRFPSYLRTRLENSGYMVFNPRGEDIGESRQFREYLMALILILDPQLDLSQSLLPPTKFHELMAGRSLFMRYTANQKEDLKSYISRWMVYFSTQRKAEEEIHVSFLSVIYDLLAFFPDLVSDNLMLIYVSTLVRQLEDVGIIDVTGAKIVYKPSNPDLWDTSKSNLLDFILLPTYLGEITVDESLFEYVPEDHISFNTFHQVKGLEFPVVMVDVGIDIKNKDIFRDDHYWDSFFFPKNSTTTTSINHHIASYSDFIPTLADEVTESFAELIRRYFVAFSRAQFLLILVGTDTAFHGLEKKLVGEPSKIMNGALGDGPDLLGGSLPENELLEKLRQFYGSMVIYR